MRGLIAFLLVLAAAASANDSAITGVGGRPVMMSGEHPSVRMERETVQIWIGRADNYRVQADFVFHNAGKAATVKMGFPERAYGDAMIQKNRSSFRSFVTTVDGRRVAAARQLSPQPTVENTAAAFWVKSVTFAPNQRRKIRVSYTAPFGTNTMYDSYATYDFTGANWRGIVAQSDLIAHFDREGTYLVRSENGRTKPAFRRNGRNFIYTWRDWQAQDSFTFAFRSTVRNWLSFPDGHPMKMEKLLPVNIEVPGQRAETAVAYMPSGFQKNGRIWVNARAWAEKSGAAMKWDAKSNALLLMKGSRQLRVPAGGETITVRGRNSATTLFVPSRLLEQVFGGKFTAELPSHTLLIGM